MFSVKSKIELVFILRENAKFEHFQKYFQAHTVLTKNQFY